MKSGVRCLHKQQPYLKAVKVALVDMTHKRLHMMPPEKKKSRAVRSGDLGGHSTGPLRPIHTTSFAPPTPKRNDAVPHPPESKPHIIQRVDFHARTAPKHH